MREHPETMTKIMAVPYVTLLFHGVPTTVDLFKTSHVFILRKYGHQEVPNAADAM